MHFCKSSKSFVTEVTQSWILAGSKNKEGAWPKKQFNHPFEFKGSFWRIFLTAFSASRPVPVAAATTAAASGSTTTSSAKIRKKQLFIYQIKVEKI